MPLINLNKFQTLEFISVNLGSIQFAVLIVALSEFLLLNIFLDRKKISSFFLGYYSLLLRPIDHHDSISTKNKILNSESSSSSVRPTDKIDDQCVHKLDVEMVLRSLGIVCNEDQDESIPDKLDADGIIKIFEEKNVSLDEMKDAFDVFDENRDGFIDAKEVQKVLCALGLKEGSDVDECRRMIGVFDENRDGRIDFDEFVKFMEYSFI